MAGAFEEPVFLPVGDTGLSVEFGDKIDPTLNDRVAALDRAIALAEINGIIETVPSFRSLLVVYEPADIGWNTLQRQLTGLLHDGAANMARPCRRWSVPVVYEPPFGEDLAEAAGILGLAQDRLVAAHTGADFRVYMLGFQPGMPNLGGLPEILQISRRIVPRAPVPPRSVIIGGVQGAIMPMPTQTGHFLLGRTPVRPFDRRRESPALFQPGDRIQFRQIDTGEFSRLEAAAEAGDLYAGAMSEAA